MVVATIFYQKVIGGLFTVYYLKTASLASLARRGQTVFVRVLASAKAFFWARIGLP